MPRVPVAADTGPPSTVSPTGSPSSPDDARVRLLGIKQPGVLIGPGRPLHQRIRLRPNSKLGLLVALREVRLWSERQQAFTARQAEAAAEYARQQQCWWTREARRFASEAAAPETSDPP